MRFKKRSHTFNLSPTGIDIASEWLTRGLEEAGADRRDRLRMRLLFEEALLNLAAHDGEEQEGTVYLERSRGHYRVRIVTQGARFNPLSSEMEADHDEWSVSLFAVIDMQVHYAYSMGANVLRLSLPLPSWNPVLKIAIALLVGAFIGIMGNLLIPGDAQQTFSATVLQPIADMWMRLLQAISGPIIFLTALTATLNTKRIAEYGGSRLSTLARYFGSSALVTLFALLCCMPFFTSEIAATETNSQFFSTTLDGILQIIPGNLIEPFSTANTLQLLIIAIVTGYILGVLDSQVSELKTLIRQLNMLGLNVAKYACSLVPIFVGLLLCLRIWTSHIDILGMIWIPLVLATGISVLAFCLFLLVTAARTRVSPLLLARKLWGPFVEALKRGTLDFSTIEDLANSCQRLLGIKASFAQAALPQGLFLYMPTSAIGILVFVLFAVQMQEMQVDQAWIVAAVVLSVVLSVATPPVTGANLLSFVMAFSYLGISNDALLDVMVFDIVFGVLCIAFDQAMLQLETITQAKRMGFLDEDVLRAPIE